MASVIALDAKMSGSNRFDWVMMGLPHGPDLLFDAPLLSNEVAVVIPSVGSLLPGWTLIVPRLKAINLRVLSPALRAGLGSLRDRNAVVLETAFDQPIWEFEHGPSGAGSLTGCGVDQAHLHQVPLPFDLIECLAGHGCTIIRLANGEDPWLDVSAQDYWLVRERRTGRAAVVYPDEPQSQGIRRVIAKQLGEEASWNYRSHPMRDHAMATAAAFRA